MTALKTIVGFMEYPIRQWRKRHAPKKRQEAKKPAPVEQYRAEFVDGEWCVLSGDGVPIIRLGNDQERAQRFADSQNASTKRALEDGRRSRERAKANDKRIQEHVRKHFNCSPPNHKDN